MTKLIGLVGHAGAGKTTTTRAAIELLGAERFSHIGFSDPFRPMLEPLGVSKALYADKSRWNEPLPQLCGQTLRYATRSLGQDWGRKCIGDDLWTRIALATALDHMGAGRTVIIDNVRYPSEFNAVKDAGGLLVAFKRIDLAVDLSHDSEKYVPELQARCSFNFQNSAPWRYNNRKFAGLLTHLTE